MDPYINGNHPQTEEMSGRKISPNINGQNDAYGGYGYDTPTDRSGQSLPCNRPSFSLSGFLQDGIDNGMITEDRNRNYCHGYQSNDIYPLDDERVSYENLPPLQNPYNNTMRMNPSMYVNGIPHQSIYSAADAPMSDQFPSEQRNSLLSRNSLSALYQTTLQTNGSQLRQSSPSLGILSFMAPNREGSFSGDWARSSLNFPIIPPPDDITVTSKRIKQEGNETFNQSSCDDPAQPVVDHTFYGQMISNRQTYSPQLNYDGGVNRDYRKSVIEIGNTDMSTLTYPQSMYPNYNDPNLSERNALSSRTSGSKKDDLTHFKNSNLNSQLINNNSNLIAVSRNLMTDANYADEQKQNKLQRNRESARLSRKRRKQYQELLDFKVSEILQELELTKSRRLVMINNTYQQSVRQCIEMGSDHNPAASQRLCDLINPMSVEISEGEEFLWNEMKSLSCPFYSRFVFWLLNRDAMFFNRYNEVINTASGSKELMRDPTRTQKQFIGPFSFWPRFICHMDLTPEQEAKLRLVCTNDAQRHSIIGNKLGSIDNPSMHIDMSASLISHLNEFSLGSDALASTLFDSMKSILSNKQFIDLYKFFSNKPNFDGVCLETVHTQLLNKKDTESDLCFKLLVDKGLPALFSTPFGDTTAEKIDAALLSLL